MAGSGRASHDYHEQPSRQPQPESRQPSDKREPATTGDQSATPTPPTAPSATAHSTQREADVILATRNLARSAAFYAQLTGRDIPARAGTAEITPGLLLHQSGADTADRRHVRHRAHHGG
jgi:hypothetical protein